MKVVAVTLEDFDRPAGPDAAPAVPAAATN
jgi:hypothetical protein